MRLELSTKRTSKRKQGTKKIKKPRQITWDDFTREELIEIAKRYKEINGDLGPINKKKEAKNLSNFNYLKYAFLFNYSRKTI
ncbi:hypothetical protein ACR34G_03545 [Mycoplasma sp. 480]|uniref:hypothetical protein n=1 Tax=Mycoplasma sp. 480 TaxID=3440155 RepID=UPI003F512F57